MKIFFLLVSLGLLTSTLTGIYMAYKFNRSKWLVTALLLAGIVVPLVLLPY
jgi:ABC-type molybdate transport system permease subunit